MFSRFSHPLCSRTSHWSDEAPPRLGDPPEKQQPAGDHRGFRGSRHHRGGRHRGSYLHASLFGSTEKVSPHSSDLLFLSPRLCQVFLIVTQARTHSHKHTHTLTHAHTLTHTHTHTRTHSHTYTLTNTHTHTLTNTHTHTHTHSLS